MMVSTVELIRMRATYASADPYNVDLVSALHGIPLIKGNWLIHDGQVKLVDKDGETLIISAPFRDDDEIYVHFAIGTEEKRIAHTLTVDGLKLIRDNLSTIIELCELERNNDQ